MSDTLDVGAGPSPSQGESEITDSIGNTQTIFFDNVSPIFDSVPAPVLNITPTILSPLNASNAINYTEGNDPTLMPNPAWGAVTVDSYGPLNFTNKNNLVIDAAVGDDTVTVNNTGTPSGLAAINVTGGGGNDTLVVNADDNLVSSADVTSTTVNIPAATPVAIGYAGMSQISIINSIDALTGFATTIAAVQDVPLNNVPVGSFGFTDQPPAELSSASAFSAAINWGDGTAVTAGTIVQLPPIGGVVNFQVSGTHTYTTLPAAGTFPVSVTIFDQGSSRTFTVNNVPVTIVANAGATTAVSPIASSASVAVASLSPSSGLTFTGIEGIAPTTSPLIGTFTDANPAATIADFTSGTGSVVVNWGDGSAQETLSAVDLSMVGTPNGLTFQINASHTYAEEGQYAVTITVTNVGGAATDITSTAIISDADPPIVLTGSVNLAADSGQSTGTLTVTNNNEPDFTGTSGPLSWVTLYATPAGGTPIKIGTVQAQTNGAWNVASALALPNNTYAITATAVDQFGATTTTAPVVIAPALEIDTVAPVIKALSFRRRHATLTVTFQDILSGMDLASLDNRAFYHLSGKPLVRSAHVPRVIRATRIIVTPGATPTAPVVVKVVFHHGREMRGGRYALEIISGSGDSGIDDNAENALSGTYYGVFPTGDGRPGGNLQALIKTYHNIIKPMVPVPAGYVSPSAAIDPSARTKTSSRKRGQEP